MTWDSTYQRNKQVWGDKPSELAAIACNYLAKVKSDYKTINILDLGCGYGRDAIYLARNIKCSVLGIDNAGEAIEMARKALPVDLEERVRFLCCDFRQAIDGKFEVVFISNVYQILKIEERNAIRKVIKERLKHGGILFLSTLPKSDPEHFGKGKRIENELNSFQDEKFLHFCTREELERDFSFLTAKELFEHEYYEPRSSGETHHHISWILLGLNQ
jgi:SAM-dependent methyltransferase